jgi:PBS lyase HEAT-like repeat-containing protein
MQRLIYGLLLVAGLVFPNCLVPVAAERKRPELDGLIEKLRDEGTSNDAKLALLKIGESNRKAKAYVADRLPALLETYGGRGDSREDVAWGDAADLAGEFGVAGAAPILCKRIDLVTLPVSEGFSNRAAAWALVLIGRPAVPCAVGVLKKGTSIQRQEAAYILGNIGGDEAHRALQEQLRVESDPHGRYLIEQAIKQKPWSRKRQR